MKILSEEQKLLLLKEFQLLKTFIQKIAFWETKLGINYFEYFLIHIVENPVIHLIDFEIKPDKSEWGMFNKWILENYPIFLQEKRVSNSKKEFGHVEQKIIDRKYYTFKSLTASLELRIEMGEDRSKLIREELKTIDNNYRNSEHHPTHFSVLYEADFNTFDNYVRFKELPDYSEIMPSVYYTLRIHNAISLAQFKDFLKNENESQNSATSLNLHDSKNPVKLGQQMQIVYYLGLHNHPDLITLSNEEKARLFSCLLKTDGTENLRKRISDKDHKDSMETRRKNLQFVIDLFEELGLEKLLIKAKRDLEKLSLA